MADKTKKKRFRVNKYELKIIALATIFPFILCLFFSYFLNIFYKNLMELIAQGNVQQATAYLSERVLFITLCIWGFFLIVYFEARIIASSMMGVVDRLMREIDEMIRTGQKKHLDCRKNDTLGSELVTRLNAFIDKFGN